MKIVSLDIPEQEAYTWPTPYRRIEKWRIDRNHTETQVQKTLGVFVTGLVVGSSLAVILEISAVRRPGIFQIMKYSLSRWLTRDSVSVGA